MSDLYTAPGPYALYWHPIVKFEAACWFQYHIWQIYLQCSRAVWTTLVHTPEKSSMFQGFIPYPRKERCGMWLYVYSANPWLCNDFGILWLVFHFRCMPILHKCHLCVQQRVMLHSWSWRHSMRLQTSITHLQDIQQLDKAHNSHWADMPDSSLIWVGYHLLQPATAKLYIASFSWQ